MPVDNDRINELIKHFFEDDDHGRKAFSEADLMEKLCFIDYLENVCIDKAKKDNKEYDLQYFTEYNIHFRMEAVEEILKQDTMYLVYSVASHSLYNVEKDIVVLINNENEDLFVSKMQEDDVDILIQEVDQEVFRSAIREMYRLGYNSVRFSDGVCRPFTVPKETLIKNENKSRINPSLYSDILIFMQEAYRASKHDKGLQVTVDSPISKSVREAVYLVPGIVQNRRENQLQIKYPFLNTNQQNSEKILPVFTDKYEYDLFVKNPVMDSYSKLPKDKKAVIELPFVEILRVFRTDNLGGVVVNPATINFVINKPMMNVIAKNTPLTDNPNVKAQRNGEDISYENPKILKEEKKKNDPEKTKSLRIKTLDFIIENQEKIIEKHRAKNTPEEKEKLKIAENKLRDLKEERRKLEDD
ncbi:MAG: SseB family protein [Acutalibacteraceae bacterium]